MKFGDIDPERFVSSDRVSVDMSEWWGEGAVVYARAVTAADHARVGRAPYAKGWPFVPSFEGSAHLLTLVAQDKDGDPFFDDPIKDRKRVMKLPMEQLEALLSLLGDVSMDTSDAEKN